MVQKVPVIGAWVPPFCLEPSLLLEQGVGDEEWMFRTELQKKVSTVIAVANSISV